MLRVTSGSRWSGAAVAVVATQGRRVAEAHFQVPGHGLIEMQAADIHVFDEHRQRSLGNDHDRAHRPQVDEHRPLLLILVAAELPDVTA